MPTKFFSQLRSSDLLTTQDWGSEKLKKLAEQLLSYRAPINFLGLDDDEDDENGEARAGGVSSSYGIPEETAKLIHHLPPDLGKKKAAVLICLFHDEAGNLRVLLTRRANSLSSHSGEVALPGGKRDEEDANNAETALREAQEEIGLDSSVVRVVTYLEPFLSKHLLRVTPVVAVLLDRSKLSLTPNSGEVDAIFDAPLEMFLKEQNYRCEEREWMGLAYRVHYFDYNANSQKYLIWGLTASILIRCATIIYMRSPEFGLSPEFVPITNHIPA
ncbi:hypothetical protein GOP47_0001137 [Adiantum capillus-veneris]|uniref:Nudix hydrolase domain-containing protein n=1 Tax=Adiantum capillus-veneris TaxID=13818 RepID=A0A9D4ZRE4_ADICA|nr:hypothetical protein GOP47_0001137 [Adiantum capillus-veneris]